MKTKTSIWLSICTLVLCLGVMTFGVYSALNAQLNIGGTLGFNMHDCMITVSGTIQNVAVSTDNWVTAELTTLNIERTIMGGESTTTTNMNLDPLYFYADEDLIFNITFTNIHTKAITATIPLPTVNGTAVEAVTGTTNGYTNFTDENNTYKASIPVGSSTKVSFALHLEDGNALATELANFSWSNITFEPVDLDLKSGIVVKKFDDGYATTVQNIIGNAYCCDTISYKTTGKHNYVQAFPYYIEMGTHNTTGEAIKWLIVGVDNNGAIAALAQEDKDAFAQGVMLNKDYYVLSEKTLEDRVFDGTNYSNEYVTSDIRTYLTGDFITTYGFTQDDLDKIQERSVKEMYATDTISVDGATETKLENGQTFPSGVADAKDEFWLLSQTEILTIFEEDTVVCTGDQWKVFMSGRTTQVGASGAAFWWLRSPLAVNAFFARYVYDRGYSDDNNVDYGYGVRAAFKI